MKKIVLIALIIFLIVWIILGTYLSNKLRENHIIVHGIVTSISKGGNKGRQGPYITYKFSIDNKLIVATRREKELKYSVDNFIGKSFPVAYGWNGLWYDDYALFTPHDFNSFGYEFPDSLNWVLEYIEER